MTARPPAGARLLVRLFVPAQRAELILGDLEEDFVIVARDRGVTAARRAYWQACARAIIGGGRWYGDRTQRPHQRRWRQRMETSMTELRLGARSLLRRPAYTFVVIVTLATAVAATSAAFAVVNGVLLRPLPYAKPHELVTLWQADPARRADPALADTWNRLGSSREDLDRLRDAAPAFRAVAGYRAERTVVDMGGEPEQLLVGRATTSLLPVLGVAPRVGTWLSSAAAQHAVISDAFWARAFGRDVRVLGRAMTINGKSYAITGVLPATFGIEPMSPFVQRGTVDVWIPAGLDRYDANAHDFEVIARVPAQVTLADAAASAQRALFPADTSSAAERIAIVPRRDIETAHTRRPLLLLFASVGVFLLLALVSVSVLTVGEAQSRQHELATRMALGASRGRIITQLLSESVLVAVPGAALGLLCAAPLRDALLALVPTVLSSARDVRIDTSTIAFAAVLASVATAALATPPALMIGRNATRATRGGARMTAAPDGLRHVLIVTQFALTTVLLVGCGLLTRSWIAESRTPAGFATANRLVVQVKRPPGVDPGFASRVRSALQSLPSVELVAVSGRVPLLDAANTWAVAKDPDVDGAGSIPVTLEAVSEDYFATMAIPIVAGRAIEARDIARTERVAVVSLTLANRLWPGQNALGKRLADVFGHYTVIGVAADVRDTGLDEAPEGVFYPAMGQGPLPGGHAFVLRTRAAPLQVAAQARAAVRLAAPGAAVLHVKPLEQIVEDTMVGDRFRALIAALFAVLAVIIGTVGLAGMILREVSRRLKELAIRMALGASPLRVAREPLTHTLISIALGAGIGLVGSFGGAKLLAAYLFGVEPIDPVAVLATIAVLSAIVLLALVIALRRTAAPDLIRQLNSL